MYRTLCYKITDYLNPSKRIMFLNHITQNIILNNIENIRLLADKDHGTDPAFLFKLSYNLKRLKICHNENLNAKYYKPTSTKNVSNIICNIINGAMIDFNASNLKILEINDICVVLDFFKYINLEELVCNNISLLVRGLIQLNSLKKLHIEIYDTLSLRDFDKILNLEELSILCIDIDHFYVVTRMKKLKILNLCSCIKNIDVFANMSLNYLIINIIDM